MTEAGLIDSVAPEVRVQTFLKGVAEAKMSALLLDFDGTLAPFRIDPAQVRPWAGVSALLDKIQAVGRTRVVIVSGRSTQEIAAQLGVATMPEIWGLHGAERRWPDGGRATDHMTPEQRETLAMARAALAESDLIGQLGLRLEDKRNAVVVHWRGSQASVVREAMARVGAVLRPFAVGEQMKLLSFDGGIELRCGGDKGDAVRALLKEMEPDAPVAYLGDDVTDEDAFNALKGRGMSGLSLSVLVRRTARPSAASVWLRPPVQLRLFLKDWLAAISNDGAGNDAL